MHEQTVGDFIVGLPNPSPAVPDRLTRMGGQFTPSFYEVK